MRLFNLNDEYEVVPEKDTIMLVPEFAELWTLKYNNGTGDRGGRKRVRGQAELVYLYFNCDFQSEYSALDALEKHAAALDAANLSPDYKISIELRAAVEKYEQLQQTRELKLLNSAYDTIDKLRTYFDSVTISDSNAKSVVDNLSKLGGVLQGLNKLQEQVMKAMGTQARIRGDQEEGFLK